MVEEIEGLHNQVQLRGLADLENFNTRKSSCACVAVRNAFFQNQAGGKTVEKVHCGLQRSRLMG